MEKTVSQEERIRRAEEIYNRRRQTNGLYRDKYMERNEGKTYNVKKHITKKILYQILASLIIYIILYVILNSNYFFSENIHNRINDFLSYDMNFSNLYNNARTYILANGNIIKKKLNSKETINNETENNETNTNEESEKNNEESNQENNAIGGAEETSVSESKSQTDMDVEYIKNNANIIWPLKGTITSKYGPRQPTDIVTANHYGIDIAGNTGDTIIAAMDGKVTVASTEGEYGKHIQVENGDISNVYAHCSKLCIKEGEDVKQGQKIAEVGQTGRATGPHLHFEIKVQSRTVDPEKIL